MKIFKKNSLILAAIALTVVSLLPSFASGVDFENPLKYNTFQGLLDAIIKFIFNLSLWVAPIMFIIGGFYYMIAQGDPAKIKTAKEILIYTGIGLIIVFSARALVDLFQGLFTK